MWRHAVRARRCAMAETFSLGSSDEIDVFSHLIHHAM